MFKQSISQGTRRVLEKVAQTDIATNFYLAGGTALAIQLGHRESIDLDWFCQKDFSNQKVKDNLSELGNFKLYSEEDGTLHGELDSVKITFLRYKYDLLYPVIAFENIKLADERDISAMKIDAASSRGSKKDFIDLYFLLKKYSLTDLISFFEKKFSNIEYNKLHILKSLIYFEDAENEPTPLMLEKVDWEKVKEKITKEVLEYMKML